MEGYFEVIASAIFSSIKEEKDNGFGGLCFPLDDYDLDENEIKYIVEMYRMRYTVVYYGDERYTPEGCQLYHNNNNAFVGKLLVIEWQ